MTTHFRPLLRHLQLCEASRRVQPLSIPPCPPLLADLIHESRQPQPDRSWVVQAIEQDRALAQALLAAVNSPLYGLRYKLASVLAAVTFGGLKYCANFVAEFMLRRALTVPGVPELAAFWERAAERALVIAYLARELGVTEFEDAHTFGLFRNCGIAVMTLKHPDYALWRARVQAQGLTDISTAERARYGIDHALLGGLLARSWCLPHDIWLPVSFHHVRDATIQSGSRSGESTPRLIAIGALADSITGRYRSERRVPVWEDEQAFALQALGILPRQLASLRSDIELLLAAP